MASSSRFTSNRTGASTNTGAGGASAGSNSNLIGANEDMFLQAFDSTPKLNIATQKKLENEFARVVQVISNPNAEWDSRVQAMKHFRSLFNSGISESEYFYSTTLKQLEIPFQNNICDLRSQVVRETCITIAFLSCRLQQKFARMAEILLPSLIKLIPNSAKIVSTSALVALRFIIQSTHNSRLITVIKYQLSSSKSKDIHRALCEIAERIVTIWPPHIIERHLNDLQEVLKLGICDSDELARQYARRAFNVFAEHFRESADKLFNSLDSQRQRMLNNLNHGGGSTLSMNGYGSTSSNLNQLGYSSNHNQAPMSLINTAVCTGSVVSGPSSHIPSYSGPTSIPSGTIVSRLKNSLTTTTATNGTVSSIPTNSASSPSRIRTPTARSTSAIDVAAQKRARARAVYLSSMYTKPRQLGTINSPAKLPVASNNAGSQLYHHQQQQQLHQPLTPNSKSHQIPLVNQSTPMSHLQYQQQQHLHFQQVGNNNHSSNNLSSIPNSPNVAQQQQRLQQFQQQQAASAEKRDGVALSKAAAYLMSVIDNNSIAESQLVSTIKYFNSLIDKHPPEVVNQYLSELMPPLVIGVDNPAISVRKASVFAMVAIHAKVGLKQIEGYLSSLTMTQRKLLEVYIKKFRDETNKSNNQQAAGDSSQSLSSITNSSQSHVSSMDLI